MILLYIMVSVNGWFVGHLRKQSNTKNIHNVIPLRPTFCWIETNKLCIWLVWDSKVDEYQNCSLTILHFQYLWNYPFVNLKYPLHNIWFSIEENLTGDKWLWGRSLEHPPNPSLSHAHQAKTVTFHNITKQRYFVTFLINSKFSEKK